MSPQYRRAWMPGGTFFFTLVTNQRRSILIQPKARLALREAFAYGMGKAGSFVIDAICVLPDHLHCILTLPEGDSDYSTRWKVIKARFSHRYLQQDGKPGEVTDSKTTKGELGVWQRRFWEHTILDLNDLYRHIDYIHYNPVKHGLVCSVKDWPWSSFHRYVQEGLYELDWGSSDPNPFVVSCGE